MRWRSGLTRGATRFDRWTMTMTKDCLTWKAEYDRRVRAGVPAKLASCPNFESLSPGFVAAETRRERRAKAAAARAPRSDEDCMIWTHTGTWLETTNQNGVRVSSDCGRLSAADVEDFCREHGLHLIMNQARSS
jgi:hypothetical protein